jgi:aldose 1-epimerase
MVHPSGEQFTISDGDQCATIVEVGGGVRAYTVGERNVLDPYAVDAVCDGAHGAPLIPWPNRLADGAYSFDGEDFQVALTEPDKRNAIHGFLRWRNWWGSQDEPDRVVMTTRLHPLPGYPFSLDVRIEYTVTADGLRVTTTATNIGEKACPYGAGQHPYLSPGGGLIDDCTVTLQASTWIDTQNSRQLPTGQAATIGTSFDFSDGRKLGSGKLDLPFTDLARDSDGRTWVTLTAPDGSRVELWADDSYPLIELYTGDTLSPDRRRRGLGCEPMTCPPNAFQSGEGLTRIDPGRSVTSQWGVRLA